MLKSVQKPGGTVVSFEYDALGRRIAKICKDTITRYVWDGNVLLHEWSYVLSERPVIQVGELGELFYDKSEPTGNITTWVYEEGAFTPIGLIKEDKHFSIVSDYIGRPVQAYDSGGELVWSADYDIYGKLRNQKGEKQFVPFRQPGQYEDEELGGLYFNRFRYYDSQTGLYISQDPIGLKGGMALYGYVHDTNGWIDVFGLSYKTVDFAGSPDLYQGPGKNIVKITMQGTRDRDFEAAFKEAGIKKSDAKGYTWHHLHDFNPVTGECTMQLVTRKAHEATYPHQGSASQFAEHFGVKYDSKEAVNKSMEKGWLTGRKPNCKS